MGQAASVGGDDADGVQNGRRRSPAEVREAFLVSRVRARDIRAFEELYLAYRPRLARFLANLVGRPPLVEEVLNDTMMVVWDRLDGFKGDSALSTWVFAIAYRKGIKALRRNDLPLEDEDRDRRPSPVSGPEETLGARQRAAMLATALRKLSPDHRTVVDLTYFHELGYREIAEIMACPVDTVKTRMFHARRRLKEMLAGDKTDWL